MSPFFKRFCRFVLLLPLILAVADESIAPVRELLVPREELSLIVASDPNRVMLPREEFERLSELARRTSPEPPPNDALFTRADYRIATVGERATLAGRLTLAVLTDGIHRLPLPLANVVVLDALLDGKPASLGRDATGACHLFVSGKGQRVLELRALAFVETTAARQTLRFEVPLAPAASMQVTVGGNVDMTSGAAVAERHYDSESDESRFQLIPVSGPQRLDLTLNNRLLRQERVVVVRHVQIAEITQTYERLHATLVLDSLHRAASVFRFLLPPDFEVASVRSPELSHWLVEDGEDGAELVVHVRSEQSERVQVSLVAQRNSPALADWRFPWLRPLDAESVVGIVGVLLDERLALETADVRGLLPIGNAVLTRALPDTLVADEPGRPLLRPLLGHYAPSPDFSLQARFHKPEARLRVTANAVLRVSREGLEVHGGLVLLPEYERQFVLDIDCPPDWDMTRVAFANGQELPIEHYPDADGGTRVQVRMPRGLPADQPQNLVFSARRTPPEWLTDWQERTLEFPNFRLRRAVVEKGAIAVQVVGDLDVEPGVMTGLTPLNENEKPEHGLEGMTTALAYRYREPNYTARIHLRATRARARGEALSFFRLTGDALHTRLEVAFELDEAARERFHILLPSTTPESVAISGLAGTTVRRFSGAMQADGRRWTIDVAQPARETAVVAIDFQQPLPADETVELELPLPRIEDVIYQSGKLAVEGSADLDIDILHHPRPVDIGELVEATYQTGPRLLGAFSYVGAPPAVAVRVRRPTDFALPAAIVERLACATVLSASGAAQTAARYRLQSKTDYLEIALPEEASLWSVTLNGRPARPQQDAGRILLDLSMGESGVTRDLTIVYEHPVNPLGTLGGVVLHPPRLLFPEANGARALPMVALDWQVYPPTGYRLLHVGGDVVGKTRAIPELAVSALFRGVYRLGGGIRFRRGLLGGCLRSLQAVSQAPRARAKLDARAAYEYAETEMAGLDEFLADADDNGVAFRPRVDRPAEPATLPPGRAQPVAGEKLDQQRKDRVAKAAKAPVWALEGVRSLTIELSRQGPGIALHSLGETSEARLRFANRRRWQALHWTVFGLIVLLGMRHLSASWARRWLYVATVVVGASVLPAFPPLAIATGLCNAAFYAGVFLLPVYLVHPLAARSLRRWKAVRERLVRRRLRLAGASLALALALMPRLTAASERAATAVVVEGRPVTEPVVVPADALIAPYTLTDEGVVREDGRLLVPRPLFERLHRLAYPDEHAPAPPAPFAFAGMELKATLEDSDDLTLHGVLRFSVFASGPVRIPLPLEQAVLERASIAGHPADLSLVAATPEPPSQQATLPTQPLVVLNLRAPGTYEMAVTLRLPLQRQGGWRVARAKLPPIPANRLTLTVPANGTELRLPGANGLQTIETREANQTVESGLAADGGFSLQWRPRLARAHIDRTLTSTATAVVDIREDRLHAVWQFDLAFRHGERELFSLAIPEGYVVEDIEGGNIRGWTQVRDADGWRVDVGLLKPAQESETFVVHMWFPAVGLSDGPARLVVPAVAVDGALRQTGRMLIRRSPTLELEPLSWTGWRRIDLARPTLTPRGEGPLGIVPFQAFEFVAFPEPLHVSVRHQETVVRVVNQTILRLAQRERRFETRLLLTLEQRPLHRLDIELTSDCQDISVASSAIFEWAVDDTADARRLALFFTEGVGGEATVLISGRLGAIGGVETVPLPVVRVPSAVFQQGEIVVQADPVFDVTAEQLVDIQPTLVSRCHSWLSPPQRALARLALHHRDATYDGRLVLRRRQPVVRSVSATNVRVTDRAIEETSLITFSIQSAGVQEVAFRLPAHLADARISAPLLRRRQVTPTAAGDEVDVLVDLQDEVMHELRVLIEHDRGLTGDGVIVSPPHILTGAVDRQYLALQDAGRDEVVIDSTSGLEPLNRQHREWQRVANLFAGETRAAFVVVPDADRSELIFSTRRRSEVQTAGGRIGLARTVLWLDAQGAYRAAQSYQVDNRTEQFLHLTLPPGTRIWTASVAGELVKPFLPNANQPGDVRIPLVKTAVGDLDYEVVLKYGGALPPPGAFRSLEFPFIRTENIRVEQSQIEVHLSRERHWYGFGGPLGQIATQAEFQVGFLDYQARLAKRLLQSVQYGSSFEKARAERNFGQVRQVLTDGTLVSADELAVNETLRRKMSEAQSVIEDAGRQFDRERAQQAAQTVQATDNRAQMNTLYANQYNDLARDKVLAHGLNWEGDALRKSETEPDGEVGFKSGWLATSGLLAESDARPEEEQKSTAQPAGQILRDVGDMRQNVAQKLDLLQLEAPAKPATDKQVSSQRRGGGERQVLVDEYRRRLEETASARPATPGTPSSVVGGLAGQMAPSNLLDDRSRRSGTLSLDVALPPVDASRWLTYRFTTPSGEIALHARSLAQSSLAAWRRLGLAALTGLVVLAVAAASRRRLPHTPRKTAAKYLAVAGLVGLLAGILPVYACLMLLAGLLWRLGESLVG